MVFPIQKVFHVRDRDSEMVEISTEVQYFRWTFIILNIFIVVSYISSGNQETGNVLYLCIILCVGYGWVDVFNA